MMNMMSSKHTYHPSAYPTEYPTYYPTENPTEYPTMYPTSKSKKGMMNMSGRKGKDNY